MTHARRWTLLLLVVLGAWAAWRLVDAPPTDPNRRGGVAGAKTEAAPDPEVRLRGRADPEAGERATEPGWAEERSSGAVVRVEARRYGTAEPMPDVLVVAVDASGRRHEGRSDAEGEVVFEGVALGEARFEVAKAEWIAESIEDHEITSEPDIVVLLLQRAVAIQGRVVAALDDSPVEGARVIAAACLSIGDETTVVGRDVWGIVETDAEGAYRFDAVPQGDPITITVLAPCYARELREMVIHEHLSAAPDLVIRLRPGGSVRGRVVDRQGKGVLGARVFVFPDGDDHLQYHPGGCWSNGDRTVASLIGVADGEGAFVVRGLALDARYAATAFASGHARAEDVQGLVPSLAESELTIELVLPSAALVDVQVLDEKEGPVSGAAVRIEEKPFGWGWNAAEGRTDAAGRIRLTGLKPGTHHVHIEADGWCESVHEVEVREGESQSLDVTLDRNATISGSAVDEAGLPLADIQVGLTRIDAVGVPISFASTGADGRFLFRGLPAVAHRLTAMGKGYTFAVLGRVLAPATDLRLEGARLGVVTGTLLPPSGVPLPDRIQIGFYETSGGGGAQEQEWPQKPLTWQLLPETWILRIEGEDFAPWEREVRVELGARLDLGDIRLVAGLDLAGVVVANDGTPVAGATVEAVDHSLRATQADARGHFELRHLRAGRQELAVNARDYLDRRIEFAKDASDAKVRIVLARGGLLDVRVEDAEGRAIVGVEVEMTPADLVEAEHPDAFWERTDWDETDEEGRVRVRLVPGDYRVRVTRGSEELAVGQATVREGVTSDLVLRAP